MYEYIAKCKVVDLPKQKELQDLNNDEIEGEIADHLKKLISSCEKETAGEWRIISHTVQLLKDTACNIGFVTPLDSSEPLVKRGKSPICELV